MSYQSEFWNRYFQYYDILLKVIPYQDLLKCIVKKMDLQPGMKILDLGAGTGNLQYYLPAGVTLVSIDNSEEALNRLRKKFPEAGTVRQSILDPLPFGDHTFDRLVANNVLYTLEEEAWYVVLREAKRVCKPGGLIVVSNLNKGFKPMTIYREHILSSIRKKGRVFTMRELVSLIYPTVMMFKYNKQISQNGETSNYTFIERHNQKRILNRMGLRPVAQTHQVYAGQASLDVCERGWKV